MGIGQRPFDLPLANTNTKETTLLNGIGGIAKLTARIDVRGQKAVDPAREMLGHIVSSKAANPDKHQNHRDQHHRRARDEIDHAPAEEHQHGLTEIRLHSQKANHRQRDPEGDHPPRRPVQIMRRRDQPSGQDHQAGLEKFRRLHRRKAQRKPAHGAFAKVGAKNRQQGQRDEGRKEPQNPDPAHHIGRHHGKEHHHHHRHTAEEGLTLHVVEWVEPVAFGQGDRSGKPQQKPDGKQDDDGGQRPFVDRPPPAGNDRLSHPAGHGAVDHLSHGISACSTPARRPPGLIPDQ